MGRLGEPEPPRLLQRLKALNRYDVEEALRLFGRRVRAAQKNIEAHDRTSGRARRPQPRVDFATLNWPISRF